MTSVVRAGRVTVVGSVNRDVVARVEELPAPGESIVGADLTFFAGGKGANQAVAAARSGAPTRLIGRVGQDDAGADSLASLTAAGVDTRAVLEDPEAATGMAMITVDAKGANTIVVTPGANLNLQASDVVTALDGIEPEDVVLVQCEVPTPVVEAAIDATADRGAACVLNLSPVVAVDARRLRRLHTLIVNEGEAAHVLKQFPSGAARGAEHESHAMTLSRLLGCAVVVTLGADGAQIAQPGQSLFEIGSFPAGEVLDTVGAGDAFAGALAAGIADGIGLRAAVRRASVAAGITVTRRGAQSSPTARELENASLLI